MNGISLSRAAQVAAAILIFSGSQAFGQVITQTDSFSNQAPGNIPEVFNSFASYNTGGTLNQVIIELGNITSTGSTTVFNTSNQTPPLGAPPGYNEDLTGGFTNTFTATSSTSGSDQVTVTITSNTQEQSGITAGNSFTTGALTATQAPPIQSASVSDVSSYVGGLGTTITVTLNAQTGAVGSANAGTNQAFFSAFATALASGDVILIYNYTPVPEPSKTTALMLGFALCAFLGRNYFKNRSGFRLA